MESFLNRLTKPYPYSRNPQRHVVESVFVSVFIVVFLWAFKPFGLHDTDSGVLRWLLPGYGVVNFIGMQVLFWGVYLGHLKKGEESWTLGKEILVNLLALLIIASLNWLYSAFAGISSLTAFAASRFLGYTILVGFIPMVVMGFYSYSRLLRKRLKEAEALNEEKGPSAFPPKTLLLNAENGSEHIALEAHQLVYLEAAGNYTEIHWVDEAGSKSKVLRGNLTFFEMQFPEDVPIIRVHRTYMANLSMVNHFSGNAQGLLLTLRGGKKEVPVSRAHVHRVKGWFKA